MNILVGYVVVLIEPDGVRLRLQDVVYRPESVGEEAAARADAQAAAFRAGPRPGR